MYCHRCGKEVQDGAVFCGHCGLRFDEFNVERQEEIGKPQAEPVPAAYQQPVPDLASKFQQPGNNKKSNKRSPLPIILICAGVVVVVVAVLLVFLFVVKPKLDEKKQAEQIPAQEVPADNLPIDPQNGTDEVGDLTIYAVSMDALSTVEATSQLSQTGFDYSPKNLTDRDKTTTWAEGVSGDGVDQGVTFRFSSKQYITGMAVRNGYQKSGDLFNKNSRVRTLEVVDASGGTQSIELVDANNMQVILFDKPIYSDWISLNIKSVYKGNAYEDTCLSEVEFFGSPESQERLEKEALTEEATTEPVLEFPRNMYVQVDELLVRTGPGTNYTAVWKLYTGEIVYVYNITNGWAHISWNGGDYYVFAQYIGDKRP